MIRVLSLGASNVKKAQEIRGESKGEKWSNLQSWKQVENRFQWGGVNQLHQNLQVPEWDSFCCNMALPLMYVL